MSLKPWLLRSLLVRALVTAAGAATLDNGLYSGLQWRLIGPFRGGRVIAVVGVPSKPSRFYFGAVDGGVWETNDAGRTWQPIFDQEPVGSIGAIAVAPSDANVIYVGSGEADMRSSIGYGNGMYKSTDAGKTWTHIGLTDTQQIGNILVDPKNANIVYVAALGHAYGTNTERGVFKSTDGGQTWQKVLYKNADTGAIDLAFGGDDQTIYAALWQTRRPPWSVYPPSNGPGSGLYKSTDEGQTWTPITGHGFPSAGLGRIGIAVSPSNPQIVYANVDAKQGGLYKSTDAGASWTRVSSDRRIWSRWWYFGGITVDPQNPDTVYICDTATYKSTDGGKSFVPFRGSPGGDDYHILWIDPSNTGHMILGIDQGSIVTLNGGKTWSSWYNQPTGQFYHVTTDHQFPYWVYGAQQDSGAAMLPSRTDFLDGITQRNFSPSIPGAESDYIAPDPLNSRYIYGTSFSNPMVRYDTVTSQDRFINPMRAYPGIYRATWTLPLLFSPRNPHVLYYSNQMLFRTDDGGNHWTIISPDLSRKDPGVPPNLDPITAKDSVIEGPRRGVIYTIAPSPLKDGEIWAGTDDGLIWLTHDEGKHWTNVTPKALTPWSKVGIIEASHFDAGTAYAAIDRHRLNDYQPYIYVTHDFGKSWKLIVHGIADGDFVNVVREDPVKRGLLYAGTEKHLYVSFDDGNDWQSLQLNLPVTSMRDIDVHGNDLVLATFGRGFWILDDISTLRQLDAQVAAAPAWLFKPTTAYRVRLARLSFYGMQLPKDEPQASNPPNGALIDYTLKSDATTPVTLEILDAHGGLVRRYSSTDKPAPPDLQKLAITPNWILPPALLSTRAGMHRFVWDLHYALPSELVSQRAGEDENYSADGVWAPPGRYTVRLTVDGRSYRQPLELKQDPRVQVTQAALQQQFELARRIEAQRSVLAEAATEAASVLTQLNALQGKASGSLAQALEAFTRNVEAVAGVNPAANPDNSIGVPPANLTSLHYLAGAFANLEGTVQSADAAPTTDVMQALSKQLKVLRHTLDQWRSLKQVELPRLNARLQSAGLTQITSAARTSAGDDVGA